MNTSSSVKNRGEAASKRKYALDPRCIKRKKPKWKKEGGLLSGENGKKNMWQARKPIRKSVLKVGEPHLK